jgi:hypothetical protein
MLIFMSKNKLDKDKIIGTNCFNCLYISKKEENVDQTELNDQGGIDPKTDDDMQKAQKADLITLPGGFKSEGICQTILQ